MYKIKSAKFTENNRVKSNITIATLEKKYFNVSN